MPPDFEYTAGSERRFIDFIHRTADGAEIYFLANRNGREESATCTFRVDGKLPELWDPVTGAMRRRGFLYDRRRPDHRAAPIRALRLAVRRVPPAGAGGTGRGQELRDAQARSGIDRPLDGPISIRNGAGRSRCNSTNSFPGRRARKTASSSIREPPPTERLLISPKPLVNRADESISISARSATSPKSGSTASASAVLWTAPWRVDITDAVKPAGNLLEIAVTNLWPNRLIGDAALPVEKRLTKTNIVFSKDQPLLESGLLGPVRLMATEWRTEP